MHVRPALPSDIAECVRIRGLTRENAVSEERLRQYGISVDSWARDVADGSLIGFIGVAEQGMAGYCFGARATGEVIVLALLPAYEGLGLGHRLLGRVVQQLRGIGHRRLFLGCSSDPTCRAHGFYRRLGWRSTGQFDHAGDEVLELFA